MPWVLLCGFSSTCPAQSSRALSEAEKAEDALAYVAALKSLLENDDARSVRAAVVSYSKFAATVLKKYGPTDFKTLHGKAASAFSAVKSKGAVDEFRKLLSSHPDWQGRLLLLDAAGFASPVSKLDAALQALKDEHPVVTRQALELLARTRQVAVVEAIIQRYLDVSKKKPKQGDAADWSRARYAFQTALKRLLQVDLPAPEDYKNYFEARKSDPKVFDAPRERAGAISSVNLFGAAITGKYIAFLIDTSGSMLARDLPLPGDVEEEKKGTTVVGEPDRDKGPQLPPLRRERMTRAKKELANVIRSLPSDIHFNIIDYSSDVRSWKKGLGVASGANKKSALAYVEGLKADGITVTDMALEEAFTDLNIDTIYLVTDGAPTHIGSNGPNLPEDALQIMGEIHHRVAELNFLRGVRIFTLGFPEAHEEFLQKLASDNGGVHVSIK